MTDDYGTGALTSGGWPADDQPTAQLPYVPTSGPGSSASQTAEVVKDEALGVAGSAKEKGSGLVDEGLDKARSVAGEAGRQARDLMDEARVELTSQAYEQQRRVAGGLRTFGRELSSMADGTSEGGLAADLARQFGARTTDVAQWLDDREPGGVLEEVKEFARRRPGAFLAIAAGAGVLAGRLTRGLKDADETGGSSRPTPAGPRTSTSNLDTRTPERPSAWPATGVQQEGIVSPGMQDTSGYYAGGGTYAQTAPGRAGDRTAGYGTGAHTTADRLDAPLTDPLDHLAPQPHDEEGWR